MEEKKISKQHIQVPHNLGERNEKIKIKMNPTDYLVYGYLRKFMNKDTYQTLVSLRKLANLVDVSINTVQASIKKLKEAGEIKVLEEKMVEVIYMKYRKAVNILNDLLLNF